MQDDRHEILARRSAAVRSIIESTLALCDDFGAANEQDEFDNLLYELSMLREAVEYRKAAAADLAAGDEGSAEASFYRFECAIDRIY